MTCIDMTELRNLLRRMHNAGWRHTVTWNPGSRDNNGAPNDDDYHEHQWTRRGCPDTITAYIDTCGDRGVITYSHDPDSGQPYDVSTDTAVVRTHGVELLTELATRLGLLDARLIPCVKRPGPGGPGSVCPGCGDPYMSGCHTTEDGTSYCAGTCGDPDHGPADCTIECLR